MKKVVWKQTTTGLFARKQRVVFSQKPNVPANRPTVVLIFNKRN